MLALVIALPLLTVIADAMGLAGGALLSLIELHIPPAQFTVRLHEALAPTTFWAGLVKAPVFAVLIGMVGAYRGMQVRESARELGRLTTVAVVQSIFMVILADALFAVLFQKLGFLMADSTSTPVVRVRGLVSRFGPQVVHHGLDLDVWSNDIFGVVGGSGSGKSVLLRTILGLRRPQGGTVELYGRDIQKLSPPERLDLVQSCGVTFQNGALISSLNVAQNIQLPLREYHPMPEKALDELAQLNLSLVGLPPDAAEKYPAQLSGGMTKRAALARALSLEPKLLLLDEPTSDSTRFPPPPSMSYCCTFTRSLSSPLS